MRAATLLLASVLLAAVHSAAAQGVKKGKGGGRRRKAESQVVTEDEEMEASHSFAMSYSVDGATWVPKGSIVVGKHLNVWAEPEFAQWPEDRLKELVKHKQYYVRVAQSPVGAEDSGFVQLAVSTCELINAAFAEMVQVTFAPHDDEKTRVIGLAPYGSAYSRERASHLDACTSDDLFASRYSTLRGENPKLAHQLVVQDKPPARPATFGPDANDLTIYAHTPEEQARRAQEEARRRAAAAANGEAPPEPREQTFWEKYWLYIVIAFLFIQLQGAADPQKGGAGGGGGGAAK